jgi:DNA-binding transcriptional regulator YhcF (GntR family)
MDGKMNLPIILTAEGLVPLYLQIKSQISYLITSGQLVTGEKLPPVRSVASALNVNPGTVAQAYRELQHEGLLDAAVGRGTFVAPTLPVSPDLGMRQREATVALERALSRLRSLGLPDFEARLRFEAVLAAKAARCNVLLIAPTDAVARKYASSLVRHLGEDLIPHPVAFPKVEQRAASVSKLLDLCYFVVTFASLVRRVQLALERYEKPFQVLGMTTELQEESILALRRLHPGTRALLLSEERYAHQSLALVVKHSPLRAQDVDLVTMESLAGGGTGTGVDLESSGLLEGGSDRLLVYTFGAGALAERLAVRFPARLELRFDVGPDSLRYLKNILLPG